MKIFLSLLTIFFSSIAILNVFAQTGFLNLDCGSTNPSYTDEFGIEWVPDDNYIKTGYRTHTSYLNERISNNPLFQTLRSFPQTDRKHCYELPVDAGNKYLVRLVFYYGNYNDKGTSSVFDVIVNANLLDKANVTMDDIVSNELVIIASSNSLDVCLGSDSSVEAFLSTIELKKLDAELYKEFISASTEALSNIYRYDLTATTTVRRPPIKYPDDAFDRIWVPWDNKNYMTVSTSDNIATTKEYPPVEVMQTAIASNSTIIFGPFPLRDGTAKYYYTFYLADVSPNKDGTTELNISINSKNFQDSHIHDFTGEFEKKTFMYYEQNPPQLSESVLFTFAPTQRSTKGPILNAAELFRYSDFLSEGTDPDERNAIYGLATDFNLSGWSGDPCLPTTYMWKWITCNNAANIVQLNLSNNNLKGTLPSVLAQLVHLERIYLNNNNLDGDISILESLNNLTILHLENNKFNGVIPKRLLTVQELTIYNNSFKCIDKSSQPSTNINYEICKENKGKVYLALEVVFPITAMFIISFLVWYFKSSILTSLEKRHLPKKEKTSPITYKEIMEATENFKTKIGEGSFGSVFHGKLNGEEVAVKIKSDMSKQGEEEFKNEIDILSVVYHKNIVNFLGFCRERNKLILIYEYLSNGTLRDHLYGKHEQLPWGSRLGIAMNIAQGIEYLHNLCKISIIHRDIKSSNILLSASMEAKISDLGLSKFKSQGDSTPISTQIKGTYGYLDPEYHYSGRLTQKSDIFSFGVVLFEIICGREPIDKSYMDERTSLLKWVRMEVTKGNLKTIVDPKLKYYTDESAWKLIEVAMACTEHDSVLRPTIEVVVQELRESIALDGESATRSLDIQEPR